MNEKLSEKILHYFLIVILFLLCIACIYPLIYVLASSLSNPLEVMSNHVFLWPVRPTLVGYKRVFENPDIWNGYLMTILYTVSGTILNVIMTVFAAYPLSRKDFFGRKFWSLFIIFTMFFSGGLIPTYLVIQKLQLYNTFWVMIIPFMIATYYVVIARSFMAVNIPTEVEESAVIDGANDVVIVIKIVFPLCTPIIAVLALFYGIDHWNEYFGALVYLQSRRLFPLQLILRDILVSQLPSRNMMTDSLNNQKIIGESIRYALIIVATLPILLVYPFIQKYFVKGMLIGSVKG